jgi:hypothetical protein
MILRVELGVLERGDRSGRGVLLKDINGASTSAGPSDCPWSSSVCRRASAQSRVVFGEDASVPIGGRNSTVQCDLGERAGGV